MCKSQQKVTKQTKKKKSVTHSEEKEIDRNHPGSSPDFRLPKTKTLKEVSWVTLSGALPSSGVLYSIIQ